VTSGSIARAATSRPFRFQGGLTLVELVTVIAIVAILAVLVGPRMVDGFAGARAFHDQSTAMLRLARATAIAQRRPVFVRIDGGAGTLAVCYNAAGACQVPPAPAGVSGWALSAPSGAAIAPTVTLQFDALGRYLDAAGADPGASLAITVSGDANYSIAVERETGYVR
jgi:MSHA pilin protein MshC